MKEEKKVRAAVVDFNEKGRIEKVVSKAEANLEKDVKNRQQNKLR